MAAIDISNAHNDFPRDTALNNIIIAAKSDPRLIPLAVAATSILMANPIYLRSNKTLSGYDHICDSLKGGGQGNALTSQIYVLTQNFSLKAVEDQCSVEIKATHDDIVIFGDPATIFGSDGDDGALGSLIHKLQADCGLSINFSKCTAVGSTPDSCTLKPHWLPEPTSFKNDDGISVDTSARGILICQNPIGQAPFVESFLSHKFNSICSVFQNSFSTLLLNDNHVTFQALNYSYQSRSDYWLATNLPSLTDPLAAMVDDRLMHMLEEVAGAPLFAPLVDGSPFPSLTGERVCLKAKD